MSVIKAKPTSPGRRFVVSVKRDLYKGKPYKPLTEKKTKNGGRNNLGRITTRHKGGGHKHHYRIIDFKRSKIGITGTVERIEYDPNRSAYIALIKYEDGDRSYIIAPAKIKIGSKVLSAEQTEISPGNSMKMSNIPLGTNVHCVEMKPGKGGQIARSAGASARIVAKEGIYTSLRLQSGEMRKILSECRATIGVVSNSENNLRSFGKAGAKRWKGIRPTVRGVAMNPIDHPHGGGEGRTSGGRHPSSPWGMPTKGFKTRKNTRSDNLIVRRRGKR
ncbi:50S ribosomal protein L2 [SAR86 cluster bacterium]|jgi:large subunit ribosomal protein L2|nr:50S ribosomal protein L2 [SAR86 cluster bacterium]|tara:strand:+ start:661 stop:1485 length:825 start_codon:yes stop_codon:yes gene_type:complete